MLRPAQSPRRNTAQPEPVNEQANVARIEGTDNGLVTAGVLLNFTAKARIHGTDDWITIRGILDNGSGNSFITSDLARRLNAEVSGRQLIRVGTFGSPTPIEGYLDIVRISVAGHTKTVTEKYIVRDFVQKISPYVDTELARILLREGKTLADTRHRKPYHGENIDMLIGNSLMGEFITMEAPRKHNRVLAQNTIFGWAISGSLDKPPLKTTTLTTKVDIIPEEQQISSVDKHFSVFWTLESLGISRHEKTDQEFIQWYIDSIESDKDGRAVIKLPFRGEKQDYDSCEPIARSRMQSLLVTLAANPIHQEQYHEVIQSYLRDGFIEEADPNYDGPVAFVPHGPIFRDQAETTKVRPVFDGSVHHKGRRSFNANLEVGPNLNPDIMGILMRFRQDCIAWTADIEKAFLQIRIHDDHCQIVRFLWVDNPKAKNPVVKIYVWKRLPFGLTSSPFILRAVLMWHLAKYETQYPGITNRVLDQIYVDDWMGGEENPQAAANEIRLVNRILSEIQMKLSKWTTNSPELKELLRGEITFSAEPSNLAINEVFQHTDKKALGIRWDPSTDNFSFNADHIINEAIRIKDGLTKRQLFSLALTMYDPLGLINPTMLNGKRSMQITWLSPTKWDQLVTSEPTETWEKFIKGLKDLGLIKIPRWTKIDKKQPSELHIFCDASETGYGAVVYQKQGSTIALIAAKSKVAPLPKKSMSIPRLELLSNVMATLLGQYVREQHRTDHAAHIWTDSQISLCWIKATDKNPEIWVQNRVAKIRAFGAESHFCEGTQNPADLLSRGASAKELAQAKWWTGPNWLPKYDEYKPLETTVSHIRTDMIRPKHPIWYLEYSEWTRIVRIRAMLTRAIDAFCGRKVVSNKKHEVDEYWIADVDPQSDSYRYLTVRKFVRLQDHELLRATYDVLRQAQRESYPEDYEAIINQETPTEKLFNKLRPRFDTTNRVIRCVGRQQALLAHYKEDALVLLPPDHYLSTVLIRDIHKRVGHLGMATMITAIRVDYWLPRHVQVIRKILDQCVPCQRQNATSCDEIPSHLPIQRLRTEDPFSVTGVDFAGPFQVLVTEPSAGPPVLPKETAPGISGAKKFEHITPEIAGQIQHVYILLFTCATTRAVHLEVTRNKSTAAFINAFRRFCALRFKPRTLYSDNAKEFESAAKYLRRLFASRLIGDYMANNNIVWRFSAKLSSWWGGFWERMVRTAKEALYKTFNPLQMDYDLFCTVVTEVSDIVNNRPLAYVAKDLFPLTPNQLLKGGFVNQMDTQPLDEASLLNSDASHITAREIARRQLVAGWWTEYRPRHLKDLNRHYAAQKRIKPIQVGQVVIAFQPNTKRIEWPVGRVTEVVKGKDGKIRRVQLILMEKGKPVETERAIQCLYPLEVEAGTIDADFSPTPSLYGDYVTSAGELWKQDSMGGVLNYSTTLDAEGTEDDTEVVGTKHRYDPPRMLEAGPRGKYDKNDGSDEQPMTEQEEERRRELEEQHDVGRGEDWVQGIWASDPSYDEPPPSNGTTNRN
jgi:hypothetical protein